MNIRLLFKCALLLTLVTASIRSNAQQNQDILNLLLHKGVITQQDADSVKTDLAKKDQYEKDHQTKYTISIGKALHLSGLLQLRYQAFQQKSVISGFDMHRARLDLGGAITDHWDYDLYIEFAGAPKLLDVTTSYHFGDYLRLTGGQFKIPFSIENLISDSQLDLIDRSQIVEAVVGRSKDVIGNQQGRDIGVQANGSFVKLQDFYLIEYAISLLDGAGINATSDNNNKKDLAGRLVFHPIRGLGIGGSFYNGKDVWGTPATTQTRNRRGLEARYAIDRFNIMGEYITANDGGIKRTGDYVQGSFFILPNLLQVVAKYDHYDPNKNVSTDISNWYIGGLNLYFNKWAKIYVDYSYRREQVTQVKNNLLSAQIQLQF